MNLTARSAITLPGIFGAIIPTTTSNQLTCQANVADNAFVFPPADAAWALQYPTLYPVSMSLTTVIDEVFTLPETTLLLDFVLVRTSNSVSASATLR